MYLYVLQRVSWFFTLSPPLAEKNMGGVKQGEKGES
jgi:hypothetical protein